MVNHILTKSEIKEIVEISPFYLENDESLIWEQSVLMENKINIIK